MKRMQVWGGRSCSSQRRGSYLVEFGGQLVEGVIVVYAYVEVGREIGFECDCVHEHG